MKVKLVSHDPWASKLKIILNQLPAVLGRSSGAEIRLADRWTSRRHCEIDQVNGTLKVRDMGSRHGTFVNGERVDQAHLLPGDKLTIGLSSFEVQYKRTEKPSADQEHAAAPAC
jgi:pSer/pThr/pTyr-binding forkhead associated (FHA) protein